VTVSLAGSFRSARARDVAESLAKSDRLARAYCLRFGQPVRLVFDLDRSTLTRAAADPALDSTLHLPAGVHIGRLVTATSDATSGVIAIPCSSAGQTPSYALLLTTGKEQHWMITAGLTGQISTASDENEVHEIFAALRPGATPIGHDAR
jgi:hypothetical protein